MIREHYWQTGTEWQCSDLFTDFYEDSELGAGLKIRDARRWLNDYDGIGRYYFDTIFNQVYFESEEDMAVFLLRWS